jgi:alkanesulfonate monooxygenase SsuD/methylene tetrahydromethanopterin reductase-like flavin-dependent oxidoreductase (luciferase family)
MTRVGVVYFPYESPPEAFRDAVHAAEDAGVAELWLWEDCFRESAFACAGAALAWTREMRIGIGLVPMPLRNAALTAMEIATVARMFPGRLLPGVGHGVQSWMQQVGARALSPLTLMREYVPALRSLLAGEEVTTSGRYVRLDAVRLDWPPAVVPPVYAGAEGPKTLALSGEVADGTILDCRHSPGELAASVATVANARATAARAGTHDVVAYAVASFGAGSEDRVRGFADDRGIGDDRALWGSVDQVADGVRRLAASGVDDVVLLPVGGPELAAYYRAVGEVSRLVAAEAS